MAYRLALTPIVKAHDIFHVYFPNKYVHDTNHVIDWTMLQVEPEGGF